MRKFVTVLVLTSLGWSYGLFSLSAAANRMVLRSARALMFTWVPMLMFTMVAVHTAKAQSKDPNIVKVPCRDMGDGRILIDSLYLPDWAISDAFRYDIIAKRATSMQGEWANLVCTLKIKPRK